MRKLIIAIWLLIPSLAFSAPFLACDPPPTGTTITQSQVEVTIGTGVPTVNAGLTTIQGANFLIYDLGTLAAGKYTFRVRWAASSGLWSEYSDPFQLEKPGKVPTLRLVP